MKGKVFKPRIMVVLLMVIFLISSTVSAQASLPAGSPGAEELAVQAIGLSAQATGTGVSLVSCQRKQVIDNIYEYTYVLKVGTGQYDKIGVHRVVKEIFPGIPIISSKAVMMAHGSSSNFDSSFLAGTISDKVPIDQSIGAYLAQNNIDVWGIDLRWTFVPDAETDLSFMKNWNTTLHLSDLKLAVKIARQIRGLTGSGFGRIFLMGHSMGALLTYAYANSETQLPELARDLKGIIPIDMVYKFSPQNDDLKQAAYVRYQALKALYDSGTYYSDEGKSLKLVAYLAATAPDDPSPIIPGFTNKQAALFLLSATYAISTPPNVPYYHYLAGIFDTNGIPTGLQYANFGFITDIGLAAPGYESIGESIDAEALMSDAVDVPYDDHLADIRVPVFYVGAAGGFGEYGIYTTTLLGSTDKRTLVVKLHPPESVALDYGHVDLLWADNAKSLVWTPIYQWIITH